MNNVDVDGLLVWNMLSGRSEYWLDFEEWIL